MYYEKEVGIYNLVEYKDKYGITRQDGYTFTKNLIVDVQPYSAAKLETDYGYKLEVTKRIFCDIDVDILESTVIRFKDVVYDIKKIIEWDDYLELMLLESEVEIIE